MLELSKLIIPSSLALIGSLIAILFGYRKWKYEQRSKRTQPFEQERRSVHKELWNRVEDIHVRIRVEGEAGRDEIIGLIQRANAFILKNSPYFDRDIHDLANRYIESTTNLEDKISQLPEEESPAPNASSAAAGPHVRPSANEIKRKRRITAFVEIPKELRGVFSAQKQANALRDQLEERVHAVLSGKEQ